MNRRSALATVAGLLAGCVSVDTKSIAVAPRAGFDGRVRAAFRNFVVYRTRGSQVGPGSFSQALRLPVAEPAVWFQLWTLDTGDLLIRFLRDDAALLELRLKSEVDYTVSREGAITLRTKVGCTTDKDPPAHGCGWNGVTIFENDDRDLVVITSGAVGGVVYLLPLGMYSRHMSVFPRFEGAPPPPQSSAP